VCLAADLAGALRHFTAVRKARLDRAAAYAR